MILFDSKFQHHFGGDRNISAGNRCAYSSRLGIIVVTVGYAVIPRITGGTLDGTDAEHLAKPDPGGTGQHLR